MFKLVVLSCALGLSAASAIAPWAAWHGAAGWRGALSGPVLAAAHAPAVALAPAVAAYNYRGPLSLAPGQPASILAHDGRPLDTLSVNVDRAVHYTAKAFDHAGGHWLKKRSAPLIAPAAAWSHTARIDWPVAPAHVAARVAAPLAWRAPVAPVAWHAPAAHWGLGNIAHAAHPW